MKRYLSIITAYIVISILLIACSNDSSKEQNNEGVNKEGDSKIFENDSMELSKDFIQTLYNVESSDYDDSKDDVANYISEKKEAFSIYLTNSELEELMNKRLLTLPHEISAKENIRISVKEITFESVDSKRNGGINLDHTFTLVMTDQDEKDTEEIKRKGQITVVETDDGLKIDRYYDNALNLLIDRLTL